MNKEYNLIVIGSGPGGYAAAVKASQCGMKVALIEKSELGGTCLNRGCIPTKALINSTELLDEIKNCMSIGIEVKDVSYNIEKIYERKEEVVDTLRSGLEQLLKKNKIDIFKGTASILSNTKVLFKANDSEDFSEIKTDKILIATGSVPAMPKILGAELDSVLTSDELLMKSDKVPSKLIIIGGGVIGIEFASIYRFLGTEVTIIEASDKILSFLDIDISKNLSMLFKRRGINICTSSVVKEIKKENNMLTVCFDIKGEKKEEKAETVLVAVGRKANTQNLFDCNLNIDMENGSIKVNENFETSISNIYAIGDVIYKGIQLAHVASAQGVNVALLMNGKKPQFNLNNIPACIYTKPEIAYVGLTKEEAENKGFSVKVGKYIMNSNARSLISKEDRGLIKIIFDEKTRIILGAHIMCANATDMISEMTLAVNFSKTIEEMASIIRPHPTYNEAVGELFSKMYSC